MSHVFRCLLFHIFNSHPSPFSPVLVLGVVHLSDVRRHVLVHLKTGAHTALMPRASAVNPKFNSPLPLHPLFPTATSSARLPAHLPPLFFFLPQLWLPSVLTPTMTELVNPPNPFPTLSSLS